nr:uncharacterized protein LOC109177248 [Ipomoea batatas]
MDNIAKWNGRVERKHAQVSSARPKCYVDASYHSNTLKASFGAVLVAPHGGFIAACAGPLPDCFSPLMAEAIACKEALSWLRGRGMDSVELYVDCAQLHSGLHRVEAPYSYAGLFIDACRAAMSSFLSCRIFLIPRSLNTLAHTLAISTGSQASFLYWDSVP